MTLNKLKQANFIPISLFEEQMMLPSADTMEATRRKCPTAFRMRYFDMIAFT